jgi:DNA-binding transcriptional regulator YiaG
MHRVYPIQLQLYLIGLLQAKSKKLTLVLKQDGCLAPDAELLNSEIKAIREELKLLTEEVNNKVSRFSSLLLL